jgi:bacterial/archaeal transporter family-2 protein
MSFPKHQEISFNKERREKLFYYRSCNMKGIIFGLLGGTFITLQGVANTRISNDIGTWQAATLTQFTGFIVSLTVLLLLRDSKWREIRQVKPLYLIGGSFAAFVIFSNVSSIQRIGVTLSISAILIAQLTFTFIIDGNGWLGVKKQNMKTPQFLGIGMMILGVIILSL